MTETDTFDVSDARLAAYARSPAPAWLWSADGTRLLWSNATGTRTLGGPRRFDANGPVARQIARLAGLLPPDGASRLVRLRGFGGPIGGILLCQCSRLTLKDGTDAILIASAESGAPAQAPPVPAAAAAVAGPAPSEPATARKQPLRFVWQIDAAQRFTIESDEFTRLIGDNSARALGRPWPQIAAELALDPGGKIAAALDSRGTFSGIAAQWPADGTDKQLTVEMSGLPVFDRDRKFQGYRGFGVCRDLALLNDLAELRERKPEPETTAPPPPPTPPQDQKPQAEPSATVVPFPTPDRSPALSDKETSAFDELARELNTRLQGANQKTLLEDDFGDERSEPIGNAGVETPAPTAPPKPDAQRIADNEWPILDRLPVGILVYRLNDLIYANRAFLEWTGYANLQALRDAGGLDSLFIEPSPEPPGAPKNGSKSLSITTPSGKQMPVQGRLFSTQWNGDNALVLMLNTQAPLPGSKDAELAARRLEAENRELKAVLDTATDGVVMLDRGGRVLSANRSAEAVFGYDARDFTALTLGDLFAPESKRPVLDYFDRIARGGAAALMNEGIEAAARVNGGGLVPLHMSIGRAGDTADKFCAVLRDITAWKRTEEDLVTARRTAEKNSAAKSEFLAKISHEIRTPLNSIIGFSEVMLDEGFGPIGNERYRDYLRDIRTAGGHLISLLNELLDLSKIEAGKLELTFVGLNLNDVVQQCVAIMQQQANRERVIIRSSLAANLPQIVADARSVRQIVLNLLSNSIKFTGTGGQVIISTAVTDGQSVVLRVRDTGAGMSEQELKAALEPFRQLATASRWGSSGTGLGLPITKALAEANHATFRITSEVDHGTLVEVAFPATRVLA
jgi:PAS domain S-box-containing protein